MTVEEILQKIKNEGIEIVIFDFDNTICDLVIDWDKWDHAIGEVLRKYDSSYSNHLEGKPVNNDQNDFIEKYGKPINEELKIAIQNAELSYSTGCSPLDRIVELIKQLDNVELWIWSSNGEETVRKYLKELQIEYKFTQFITRTNVDFIKPSNDGFQKYKRSDLSIEDYLMIGNSANDREAAKNVGLTYIDVKEIE